MNPNIDVITGFGCGIIVMLGERLFTYIIVDTKRRSQKEPNHFANRFPKSLFPDIPSGEDEDEKN